MRHVAKLVLDALYASRKREAELFIRRYSHVIADVPMSEPRREIDMVQAEADDSASCGMQSELRAVS
jgi:hypothetical protein